MKEKKSFFDIFTDVSMNVFMKHLTYKVKKRLKRAQKESGDAVKYEDYLDMSVFLTVIWCWFVILLTIITIITVLISCILGKFTILLKIMAAITLVAYLYGFMLGLWYIAIRNDGIEKCNMFGVRTFIPFKDITQATRDYKDSIHLYIGKKKVFSMEKVMDKKKFLVVLRKNKIKVMPVKYSIHDFVLKESNATIVVYGIECILSCIFIYASFFCRFIIAILGLIAGVVFLILSLRALLKAIFEKTVVKDQTISQYALFRKTKRMLFSEVEVAVRRKKDEVEYVYLYSKDKKELCISMAYSNAHLMEKLIKEQGWGRRKNYKCMKEKEISNKEEGVKRKVFN